MEQRGQSQARLSYAESRQSSRNSNSFELCPARRRKTKSNHSKIYLKTIQKAISSVFQKISCSKSNLLVLWCATRRNLRKSFENLSKIYDFSASWEFFVSFDVIESVIKRFSQIFKRFSKDFLLEEQSKHINTLRVEIIQKSTSKSVKKLKKGLLFQFYHQSNVHTTRCTDDLARSLWAYHRNNV